MGNYVYVVYGAHHDGECLRDWDVIAFTEEQYAINYAERANAENAKIKAKKRLIMDSNKSDWYEKVCKLKNKLDTVIDGNDCDGYYVKSIWLGLNIMEGAQPSPACEKGD